jgi:hypothetical protein
VPLTKLWPRVGVDLIRKVISDCWLGFRGDDPGWPRFDQCQRCLTQLIRSLALVMLIKNLGRHSSSRTATHGGEGCRGEGRTELSHEIPLRRVTTSSWLGSDVSWTCDVRRGRGVAGSFWIIRKYEDLWVCPKESKTDPTTSNTRTKWHISRKHQIVMV